MYYAITNCTNPAAIGPFKNECELFKHAREHMWEKFTVLTTVGEYKRTNEYVRQTT